MKDTEAEGGTGILRAVVGAVVGALLGLLAVRVISGWPGGLAAFLIVLLGAVVGPVAMKFLVQPLDDVARHGGGTARRPNADRLWDRRHPLAGPQPPSTNGLDHWGGRRHADDQRTVKLPQPPALPPPALPPPALQTPPPPQSSAVEVRNWWSGGNEAEVGPTQEPAPHDPSRPPPPDVSRYRRGRRLVQCPRCASLRVDLHQQEQGPAFRCADCRREWTWTPGEPWPTATSDLDARRALPTDRA